MADFTYDELSVLIEALDTWKDKNFMDREEAAEARDLPEWLQARAAAKANRKGRATILQGKLLKCARS